MLVMVAEVDVHDKVYHPGIAVVEGGMGFDETEEEHEEKDVANSNAVEVFEGEKGPAAVAVGRAHSVEHMEELLQ